MLSLADARALLLADLPAPTAESQPLDHCAGRTLAGSLVGARHQPPDAVSAMDGYAVRAADASVGAVLRVIGEAPAGTLFAGSIHVGEAVRIATGGVVPPGADAILIQEHAERDGDSIRVAEKPTAGEFIRARGCDFAAGQQIASAGDALTPARIGLAAAANFASVPVAGRPRIAILPSGDELREPGDSLQPGQIVNSATYALEALVARWGGEPRRLPIVADDLPACEAALSDDGEPADVLVAIGGASVGDRDLFRPAAERLGATILFDKVAVQPGKPCWHARFPDGRLLLGLPGNPASAFVCAHLFLKPLIYALLGRDPTTAMHLISASLECELAANGARETYLRGTVSACADGRSTVRADPRQDSSLLTPLASANALIRRAPLAATAAAGDPVELLPIEPI